LGQLTWDGLVPGDRERVLPENRLLVHVDQPHEIRQMGLLVHVDQVDENCLLVHVDQDGNSPRGERNPDDGS
jgi:hypothetical protein